ncbi:tail fiber protein [Flavobacterium sp. CECT 9288]|uniref:tail fiber protein n=1 Tax=Flavobacterium sp. CECT 9288 TaxID=2845819 RepID=UPI001E40E26A|nr:tail fiber protein [Flavobacterium sp. CECT 9288]
MKITLKCICLCLFFFSTVVNSQTLSAVQLQNARATGYAIVASKNPGKSFSILMIKWDGINDLEYNANNQINPGWHPQAVVKGNYFYQAFENNDFSNYSSVLVSQSEFDYFKHTGSDWWIVCSTLPSFSNSGLAVKVADDKSGVGGLNIETNNGTSLKMGGNTNYSWIQSHNSLPLYINELGNNSIFNLTGGNVGIGTANPTSRLDVNGNINLAGVSGRRIFMGGAGGSTFGLAYDSTYPNYGIFYTEGEPDFVSISPNGDAKNGVMNVFGNGNVGIGTTNPTSKLTVAGNINSREVKVSVDAGADFVFDKDYALPSLQEVEKFVTKNKHLPEIASAKEMQKEGINLSEMNIKLLQKIEELTLYVIELKKENEAQNKKIEQIVKTKK